MPWLGIALGLLLPVLGFIEARTLPEQFFPATDRDQIQIEIELASSAVAGRNTKSNRVSARDGAWRIHRCRACIGSWDRARRRFSTT